MIQPVFLSKPLLADVTSGLEGRRARRMRGGAAIEYIIVSTFAMLMAVGGVVFVSKALKTKMSKLEEKLGITFDGDALDLFK